MSHPNSRLYVLHRKVRWNNGTTFLRWTGIVKGAVDWNNMPLAFCSYWSVVFGCPVKSSTKSIDQSWLIRNCVSASVWIALHTLVFWVKLHSKDYSLLIKRKKHCRMTKPPHIKHFQNTTWSWYRNSHSAFPLASAFRNSWNTTLGLSVYYYTGL